MKKKVVLLSLALMLLLTGVVSAAALWGQYKGYNIMRITVDGKEVKSDVPAFVFDNRTMVPVYLLKEAGISYSLDGKNQTVNISSKSNSTTAFDPTAATKEIIALGGMGVTIMNIGGETTAMVYFDQKINYNSDWPNIDKIFKKLVAFNSTFSRVEYGYEGATQGVIEIRTKNYKDYLNGTITNSDIDKLWLLSGSMFENTNTVGSGSNAGSGTQVIISYPELYSNDLKTFLGKLTTNAFDNNSVFNEFGTYGSKFNSKSIWNEFGTYGGNFSNQSAFNTLATKPPAIVLDSKVIGYLTTNTTITNAISPVGLKEWLDNKGY